MKQIILETKELKTVLKAFNKSKKMFLTVTVHNNRVGLSIDDIVSYNLVNKTRTNDLYFTVELKEIKRIIDKCKNKDTDIVISDDVTGVIHINDLPILPIVREVCCPDISFHSDIIRVNKDMFIKAIKKSCLQEKNSFHKIIDGINFNIDNNVLEIASTNGKILNIEKLHIEKLNIEDKIINNNIQKNFTIKKDIVNTFIALYDNIDEFLTFYIYEYGIVIRNEKYKFNFKLMEYDRKYPNVKAIVPEDDTLIYNISFNKKNAIDIIEKLALIKKEDYKKSIGIKTDSNKISFITFNTKTKITAVLELKAVHNLKDKKVFCFDYLYLLELLKTLNNDNVQMQLAGDNKPCVIRENNSTNVIMCLSNNAFEEGI